MSYTIKDVAKKANVSIATVSRILNGQGGYSEKTKSKVLKVIEELGYQPNAVARGLINKRTHTIGVLFPKLSSSLVTDLLDGIEKAANDNGSSVIVCHTESNGEKTMKYLQLLIEKRVDGIIFASEILKDEYYQFVAKTSMPMILLSTESYAYPVPFVKVNDFHAAYAAAKHLIDKGHTRIGMISGNKDDIIAGIPRIEGFKKALTDHNIPLGSENIVFSRGFTFPDGVDGLKNLIKLFPDVTAIFAASDEMAIGALSAAYQMGIRVPDEVSVIGYDNLNLAEMSIPPLTTVGQPLAKMGETAAEMLFSILETGETPESRIMPHKIIERMSVKERK
ncbi:LacI family transcriptional regulator [Cytobacillus firmus]|uniref:LacI family DNA-binding transcriptional regulator n=1 Tax=Cytobacillus firmus TaxID=1399 RepID=UPI00077C10D6|nr:LacI family DNA-binding transcriptional regulator [Cytobacillus firmus]MBG9542407.1 LacI family transcriptional regulator [Cytobacillus firmus]MBG9547120.1 LacI family transcriptional regulator [Cytobacillus firmus]MBG9552043.1 LacI family transcriptional regulator [Cytobacillus firmus]MBG9558326.1 LacI family transcriptional regulator [Cytobacillus firmus]MBG9573423.1 LacI family transcriptional regulator [Cytobacillus firmus]